MADAGTEQSLGQWRSTQYATADGTSTLAEDGNLRWVATKLGDVALNPLQGENLVEDTIVARVSVLALLGEFGVSHEAQSTSAILDADDYYTTLSQTLPQVTPIPLGLESTTMYPYHHGQFVVDARGRCGDTQIQAVLAHLVGSATRTCGLRRHLTELVAHTNTLPSLSWLRVAPTQIAHWRCSVWDGLVDSQSFIGHALNVACLYVGFKNLRLSAY